LTKVKPPDPPPNPDGSDTPADTTSKAGDAILKATTAQAKSKGAHKADYQRPHQAHVYRHIRVATLRKNRVELEEEARRHYVSTHEGPGGPTRPNETDRRDRIEGLNFDERRKKKGKRRQDEDERDGQEGQSDDGEEATQGAQAAIAKGLVSADGAGKYFQDLPEDRLGDLTLTNPNEMKRVLGPSVRFAKHAMLLAEDQLKSGAPRDKAIEFLASLYVGLADREYAYKALKDFGAATGIIDLYPLEVMKHLFEHVPSFFNRVTQGRFLTSSKPEGYEGQTGVPIVLTYDPKLRVRGFALRGGERPGYLLEPVDPPGTYHLVFDSPGHFLVLISAIDKAGELRIEEFEVDITRGARRLEEETAVRRERASERDH
jgi:hypothetical protein